MKRMQLASSVRVPMPMVSCVVLPFSIPLCLAKAWAQFAMFRSVIDPLRGVLGVVRRVGVDCRIQERRLVNKHTVKDDLLTNTL